MLILASSTSAMAEVKEKQRQAIEELTKEQLAVIAELDRRVQADPSRFTPEQIQNLEKAKRQMQSVLTKNGVPLLPDEYTILCSSEKSTGLDWVNGDWEPVQYKNTKQLVVKSKENDCSIWGVKSADDISKGLKGEIVSYSRVACLNFREFGKPYSNKRDSSYCEEYYRKFSIDALFDYTAPWNIQISCKLPKMVLKPNGWYHRSHFHAQLDTKNKDSLAVEVGKCAMIKP
jgi:hypothetical protein